MSQCTREGCTRQAWFEGGECRRHMNEVPLEDDGDAEVYLVEGTNPPAVAQGGIVEPGVVMFGNGDPEHFTPTAPRPPPATSD